MYGRLVSDLAMVLFIVALFYGSYLMWDGQIKKTRRTKK